MYSTWFVWTEWDIKLTIKYNLFSFSDNLHLNVVAILPSSDLRIYWWVTSMCTLRDHPLLVVGAFFCLFHLESYPSWSLALLVGSPPSCGGGLCLPLSPGELSKLESCTPCGITPFLWWRPLFASFTWRAIQAGVLHFFGITHAGQARQGVVLGPPGQLPP